MTNKEIIEKYLNGLGSPNESEREEALALLADDFTFNGPMMQHNSKQEFLEGMRQMPEGSFTGLELVGTAQDGDWVGSYYFWNSSFPDLDKNACSEWFEVKGGKIKRSYLVFDTFKWRKVMEESK